MSNAPGHSGRPYRRLKAWVYANRPHICLRCGGLVDMGLRHIDPRHPKAPSLDLVIPQARGGPLTRDNSAISHLGCNAAYRDGRPIKNVTTQRTRSRGTRVRYTASREW